ncbi:WD40-repeat-containing domain protein [Mortierella sp. GBAus27b]|nr:WD40-repeat-containing domain protein [Mortierella sp. GBAus27b]
MYRRSEDLRLYPLIPVLEYSLSKSNIWCSDLDSDKVAIGGDRKLVLLREWNTGRNLVQTIRTASDVFSVQIEPLEQRNIVYAGCRDGYVQIFDMNRPIPSAGPKEGDRKRASILDGIGHKQSPVNCMKRVSHHYLVTSAMNGEILMWDTRFVGGHSSSSSGATAKPVLDIREPLHNFFAKTSFDVNIDETLLAARQGNDQVSIWSLSTGDRIRDLEVSGPVGCFSFSTTSQGIWTVAKDQLEFSGDSSA